MMLHKEKKISPFRKFLLTIVIIIASMYAVLTLSIIFGKDWENPAERNYLYFENDNIDNIVDSLNILKKLVKKYPFPKDMNSISIDFYNDNLWVNNNKIGEFSFTILRKSKHFINFSDEQINRFMNLYNYLDNNFISPFYYDFNNNILRLDYKDYYKFCESCYGSDVVSKDLFRFIKVVDNKEDLDLVHHKILDSHRNIYLTTSIESKIWGDSIKYEIRK